MHVHNDKLEEYMEIQGDRVDSEMYAVSCACGSIHATLRRLNCLVLHNLRLITEWQNKKNQVVI